MDRISLLRTPVTILLAEDNPGDVYIIRSSLADSKLDHNFYHVDNGEEIMAYLHQEQGYENAVLPDLILLDLNLPKKHGFEVLKEIKTNPEFKAIPVIILTSSKSDQDILKAYELYGSCFVTKPFDFEEFTDAIKKIENFWLNLVHLPPKLVPES